MTDTTQAPSAAERLQSLHLAAHAVGSVTVALQVGDADGLLWDAPSHRVVSRLHASGDAVSEIRALVGDSGELLAWWQRTAGVAAAGAMPYPLAHITVLTLDLPGPGVLAPGLASAWRESVLDELAERANVGPLAYRFGLLLPGLRHRATDPSTHAEPAPGVLRTVTPGRMRQPAVL